MKICEVCSKEIMIKQNIKFCSEKCRLKYHKKRGKDLSKGEKSENISEGMQCKKFIKNASVDDLLDKFGDIE